MPGMLWLPLVSSLILGAAFLLPSGIASLHPSFLLTRLHSVRMEPLPISLGEDETLLAQLHANGVSLFPWARIRPACSSTEDKPMRALLASSGEDKHPLVASLWGDEASYLFPRVRTSGLQRLHSGRRKPPFYFLRRGSDPTCFLGRGQASFGGFASGRRSL